MKNNQSSNHRKVIQVGVTLFIAAILILCVGVIVLAASKIIRRDKQIPQNIYEREYTVLITGSGSNESFLSQVCEGALSVGSLYDSSVQFYVPSNQTGEGLTQSLFDYASYISADCIITYIDDSQQNLEQPKTIDGKPIPLITLGSYASEIPQVSYIGINKSQLGSVMGQEIISFLKGKGSVFLINTNSDNDDSFSTTMNSLMNVLADQKDIQITVSKNDREQIGSVEDSILQEIASLGPTDLIVALSEKGTIRACQSAIDLNLTGKTAIIGFGEGEDTRNYFEKGILTELLSVDPYSVGKSAVQQFYEYVTTGYANNYVVSDIVINRNGGAK
ncbi:MAG: substrate-binding domain-containing protein [Treponema sp.]|nr:substrate-binding domain-containing protein [Treponema sp.]